MVGIAQRVCPRLGDGFAGIPQGAVQVKIRLSQFICIDLPFVGAIHEAPYLLFSIPAYHPLSSCDILLQSNGMKSENGGMNFMIDTKESDFLEGNF